MTRNLAAGLCGLIFGLGLLVSGMANPGKVFGFLDIFGNWDASLALVMGAAVPAAAAGHAIARRLRAPVCSAAFAPPAGARIDARLMTGASLFGIGWGLAGYCPGPALVSLGYGKWQAGVFVCAMAAGMAAFVAWQKRAEAPG